MDARRKLSAVPAYQNGSPETVGDPIRSVLETAQEGFIAMDAAGFITEWNPQAEITFGWSRDEVIGRVLADTIVPPARRATHWQEVRQILQTGAGPSLGRRLELRALHRDGHEFPVEITISAVWVGHRQRFTAFLHDISDRKKAEAQSTLVRELVLDIGNARTADDGLALALEKICNWAGWKLGEAWVKTEDGTMLERRDAWFASSRRLETFGQGTKGDPIGPGVGLPGRAWQAGRAIWVEDVRADPNFLRAELAKQVGLGAAMAVPITAGRDVAAVLVFYTSQPQLEDPRMMDAVADVAAQLGSLVEHKRTEEGLRRSEARYRLLAENSTDVISVTDSDGVILYVSPSCEALVGFTPEELVGSSGLEFVHKDDLQLVNESYRWTPGEADRLRSPSFRVRRKDDTYVWTEVAIRPVVDPDSGKVLEMQASARDITERKLVEARLSRAHAELERQTAALKLSNVELERFAYDASHDLAEPLRMMAQSAGRLCREYGDSLDDDGRRLLVSLVDGLERAQTLIADLLEYSQVALSPLKREPIDCEALLGETLAVLEESIDEKRARITRDRLPTIHAHPTRLGQCFQNLLSNALKFAREDQALEIHVGAERQPGGWGFYVQDNGIGIDPSDADRAFELFGRLHPQDAYAGTGMGLSICRRVVEQHGGRIWVEPAPGGGSIFSFTIADERADR
jgi:PAS domain S-box-containing protein